MSLTLGVDQSYTSSGYCIIDAEQNIIEFGRLKSDTTKDVYERALETAKKICELIEKHSLKKVNLEGLAFGIMGNATRDLAGLLFTIINLIKYKIGEDVEVTVIAPTSVKKLATGSGKAKKKDMVESLPKDVLEKFKQSGLKITTGLTDVTDAYWISRC